MNDSEANRDEASRRLGGPSKIGELEDRLLELEVQLKEKVAELENSVAINRVQVGRNIKGGPQDVLLWVNETGVTTDPPAGLGRIEGLGYDWCVVRCEANLSALYYTSYPGFDIRPALSGFIID